MRRPVKPFVTEYRGGSRRPGAGGQSPKQDLFNIDPKPSGSDQRNAAADSQEDSYEAALRAADAFFSTRGGDAAPASPEAGAPAEPTSSSATSGRVLRDLNEPVASPEMLRLEAERAPKRRGRKPGSKNKPKPVPPLVAREAVVAPAQETAAPAMPARIYTLPRGTARRSAATVTAGDRYAWVRTKLKPGQQWKRRLPKVAW